jgi:rod shape-determining protein MreB
VLIEGVKNMLIDFLKGLFSVDIGIDLGTANTLIYVKGRGVVLSEPSVVTIFNNSPIAYGMEAKKMIGKTPGEVKAIRPLRDGVIAYFDETESMIRYFIQKVHKRSSFIAPRIIVGVPCGITEVEKRAVVEATESAGARKVYLIEEPKASAIGADIDINEPTGNMIVDIGGGTTEVAVLSLGGIVISKSVRVAGDNMDQCIIDYLKGEYNLLIGERTAEKIKIQIGSAFPLEEEIEYEVKGRDLISGLPKLIVIDSKEIREALKEPVNTIIGIIKSALEETPPELASDIVDRGILLTGGGALLNLIDKKIAHDTGLLVKVADNPLTCVVIGTGKALENIELFSKITLK